jgi:hypothetical protein
MTYQKYSPEYQALEGFFFQCWCAKWDNSEQLDHAYYAQTLDKIGIPWSLQNRISGRAYSDRNSGFMYFSTILSEELAKLK